MLSKIGCYGHKTKLSAFALGLGLGVTKALFILLMVWFGTLWMGEDVSAHMPMLQHAAVMDHTMLMKGLILAGRGFLGGFFFGLIAGWIYNLWIYIRCRNSEMPVEK